MAARTGLEASFPGVEATGTHRDDRAEGREERDEDQESRVQWQGRGPRNEVCMYEKMCIRHRLNYGFTDWV